MFSAGFGSLVCSVCVQAFDSCYDATKARGAEEQECMPLVRVPSQPAVHCGCMLCDECWLT